MDAFVNLLKGVSERASNPVASTFAIAFAICNWPISLALITGSATSPTSRLDSIRMILESSAYDCLYTRLVFIPIASTAAYLWGMPYLRKVATAHLNKRQFEGDKIREQAYLNIIGEMLKHEETIQFAHHEFQNAYTIYKNTLGQLRELEMKPDFDPKAKVNIKNIYEQNLGNLQRLRETHERFLGHYNLIQNKNSK